jgi:hypothetical protein
VSLGGVVFEIDINDFIVNGTDGDSYTLYLLRRHRSVSFFQHDIDFESDGRAWTITSGWQGAGDDDAFDAIWSSFLLDYSHTEANTYQARYDGAGTVTVLINDRLFKTLSWTLTAVPACVSIGGRPQEVASAFNSFFSGRIWNAVIQEGDIGLQEFDGPVYIYDSQSVEQWSVPVVNPGAEIGDNSGWTIESGELTLRDSTDAGHIRFGDWYFAGGTSDPSIVRQRFDIETLTDLTAAEFHATGDGWVIVEWYAANPSGQTDYAFASVRFLDESLTEISLVDSTGENMTVNNQFAFRAMSANVPAGARYLDVRMTMDRGTGSPNDAMWDQIQATLYRAQI